MRVNIGLQLDMHIPVVYCYHSGEEAVKANNSYQSVHDFRRSTLTEVPRSSAEQGWRMTD
jgi:hypothetical protein